MAAPSAIHSVDDHLGVTIHELSVDGINSADPIVLVDSLIGFDRLTRLINLGLVLAGFVLVGLA
jgi:hypothetical protein